MNTLDRIQKRIFDVIVSSVLIVFFLLGFVLIALLVWIDLKEIFFKQKRVGRLGQTLVVWKFKTRRTIVGIDESEVDFQNNRLTKLGAVLRRLKLDELPQLFQVLVGQMSIIGPRPELPEYVKYHRELRAVVLSVKPGLIDLAAIKYFDEDSILQDQDDPKSFYIEVLLKEKMQMSLQTINRGQLTRSLIVLKFILKRKHL